MSLIFATQLTAMATAALAVFAIVTAEGGANDRVANELGAAKDEQTHVNIVPGWRLRSRPGLVDGRSAGEPDRGANGPESAWTDLD